MPKHEFGIIDCIKENKWDVGYEPEKYNCISVSDDLIEEIIENYTEELKELKTYFQDTTHSGFGSGYGLDYCGITLIPPNSLKQFCNIITKANSHYQSRELQLLLEKIFDARNENKYLIHYGI